MSKNSVPVMGNSSGNWVCDVGTDNGGTIRGMADCNTRDAGGGGAFAPGVCVWKHDSEKFGEYSAMDTAESRCATCCSLDKLSNPQTNHAHFVRNAQQA